MKRILAVILSCLLLTGCEAFTFSVDELLVAPSISDDQEALKQALYDNVGHTVTLAYPQSGDYRSAFVIADLDGDENDEALVFYTASSATASGTGENVRVAVFDKDSGGDWHAMYEVAGGGSSVDNVIVTDYGDVTDIVIGYGTSVHDESAVSIYRYENGVLRSTYDGWYTEMISADIDLCGTDEIVLFKKSGTAVSVGVIKSSDGLSYVTAERMLTSSVSAISNYVCGILYGETGALFIDVTDEDGYLLTEVVYLVGDTLTCLSAMDSELLWMTERTSGYLSMDYDNDGIIEIPTIGLFSGYSAGSSAEYMVNWLSYSEEELEFVIEASAYYNLSDSYIFKLPSRWTNFISVIRDGDTGEITFVEYDRTADSLADMKKLLSIISVSSRNAQTYLDDGYTLITESDSTVYLYKGLASDDEPLLLTPDEISDNLYITTQ
ncbi:MAG: hypothetical protein LUH03_04740 [Oscillospiraceae bacterium]|nr:hypothetical protein [Oscillospiraceae bacterium]